MKLSFSTLGCPNWDLDTIINQTAEIGFDGIELRGILKELDIARLPEFSTRAKETVAKLEDAGIDAIELSGGTAHSGKFWSVRKGKASPKNEGYYKDAAKKYKRKIRVPLMLVGGIRSYEVTEDLMKKGVDYVSLCRPLIREPDLINRWMAGDRRRSTCVSDNLCLTAAFKGKGLYCVADEKAQD